MQQFMPPTSFFNTSGSTVSAASLPAAAAPSVAPAPVSDAINAFAFDLLHQITAAAPHASSFLSPLSIAQALAMLLNGAPDECVAAAELRRALHVDANAASVFASAADRTPTSVAALNAGHRRLLDALSHACTAGVELSIANSVWVRGAAHPEFAAALAASYGATAAPLTGAEPINAWCAQQTRGRIPRVVGAIDQRMLAILVNAVYFKGTWRTQFEKSASRPMQPFTSLAGAVSHVTMMHQGRDNFRYAETASYQAIELAYGTAAPTSFLASASGASGTGAGAGMVAHVLLPRAGLAMADFIRGLDVREFSALAYGNGLSLRAGDLALPRFATEAACSLKETLRALGVRAAFAPEPFTRINAACTPAYVSDVLHKTFVECNEEGTEAAAATAVMCFGFGGAPSAPARFSMRCDRPFVFSISAHKTLLFIGVIDVKA